MPAAASASCCCGGVGSWLSELIGGARRCDALVSDQTGLSASKSKSTSSLVSTAASISDLDQVQPDPSALGGFGLVDAPLLLSFASPASIATLRSTARCFHCEGGYLGRGDLHNVLWQYLGVLSRASRCPIQNMHEAAEMGDLEAFWSYVEVGTCANSEDRYGMAPWHYAAHTGHIGICKMLVARKADVNTRHTGLNIRNGWSPLHFAAYAGRRDVLVLLLLHGADVNQLDAGRRTALHYAETSGKELCSRVLRKFGGVADTHLVDQQHLRESMYFNEGQRIGHSAYVEHQWDASADAADMYAEGAAGVRQYPEGSLADQERLYRYIGPAGDSGPNLTHGASVMPGFEW